MYAIIDTSGRQYKVSEGQKINVDLLEAKKGDEIVLDKVLFVQKEGGSLIGTPNVQGASVTAVVSRQYRAPKVIVFKRRAKKGYKKLKGHREYLTELEIKKIVVG